jgi:hypothetical protein
MFRLVIVFVTVVYCLPSLAYSQQTKLLELLILANSSDRVNASNFGLFAGAR